MCRNLWPASFCPLGLKDQAKFQLNKYISGRYDTGNSTDCPVQFMAFGEALRTKSCYPLFVKLGRCWLIGGSEECDIIGFEDVFDETIF